MSDESSGGQNSSLRLLHPPTERKKRIYLPAWLRYTISALLGAGVAALSSYGLRKLGY